MSCTICWFWHVLSPPFGVSSSLFMNPKSKRSTGGGGGGASWHSYFWCFFITLLTSFFLYSTLIMSYELCEVGRAILTHYWTDNGINKMATCISCRRAIFRNKYNSRWLQRTLWLMSFGYLIVPTLNFRRQPLERRIITKIEMVHSDKIHQFNFLAFLLLHFPPNAYVSIAFHGTQDCS